MAKCRFLYDNKITDDAVITVSSQKVGVVTTAVKEGSGSATMTTSGNFSGSKDLEYLVECDGIGAGAEVGQATFKWSDGGGSWDATGVTTPSIATELNNGAYVAFASGDDDDFAVGDKWYFKGLNYFSPYKMIDNNRDTRYRSAALGLPNTVTIDLGSAKAVNAIAIYDHNFTSGATITLKGNTADSWESPAFSETITYNAEKILQYLTSTQTYRYWQLQITDAANSDGYIEIGTLGLFEYMELSKNFANDWGNGYAGLIDSEATQYGVRKQRFYNWQESIDIQFKNMVSADWTKIQAMLAVLGTRDDGIIRPFFFNVDSTDATWFYFCDSLVINNHKYLFARDGEKYQNFDMAFQEVLRSV